MLLGISSGVVACCYWDTVPTEFLFMNDFGSLLNLCIGSAEIIISPPSFSATRFSGSGKGYFISLVGLSSG